MSLTPNAISVNVEGTEEKAGGSKKPYTVYNLRVTPHIGGNPDASKSWAVQRRYQEFDALYKAIRKAAPSLRATFPSKSSSWFSKPEKLIESRRHGFNTYLSAVIAHPTAVAVPDLAHFLDVSSHKDRLPSLPSPPPAPTAPSGRGSRSSKARKGSRSSRTRSSRSRSRSGSKHRRRSNQGTVALLGSSSGDTGFYGTQTAPSIYSENQGPWMGVGVFDPSSLYTVLMPTAGRNTVTQSPNYLAYAR